METFRLLMILVSVGIGAAQVDFSDPCYLMPYSAGLSNTGKLIDLEIPKNCTHGTVDWNYPAGTLDLRLTRRGIPYLLCLQNNWTTGLGGLKKVVNGVETEIPLPTKDTLACTEDVDGKTRLLVSAVSPMMYMTSFNYRVIPLVTS